MFDIDEMLEFERNNFTRALYTLPVLNDSQLFLCGSCDIRNDVKPVPFKHVYQRSIDPSTGQGGEKFETVYVSECCKGDLVVWDAYVCDFVDIAPEHYVSDQAGEG